MKRDELLQWMKDYNINYYNQKEMTNGILYNLSQCPFCEGEHKDGAYIIHLDKGVVIAKCHHASCEGKDWKYLYKLKTGRDISTEKKHKKGEDTDFTDTINDIVEEGKVEFFFDSQSNVCASILSIDGETKVTMPVNSYDFRIHLQKLIYEKRTEVANKFTYDALKDYFSILAYQNGKKVKLNKRIAFDEGQLVYELNPNTNECVVVNSEGIHISNEQKVLFKHSRYYNGQVPPILDPETIGQVAALEKYIMKYFNLSTKDDVMLFSIYLVSCFLGPAINHPVLSISGSRGSGKSSAVKRFVDLVDPKTLGLGNVPKRLEDISLRVSNNYVSAFDNLSYLTKDVSDLFCRIVTQGTDSRRTLYENDAETTFELQGVVVVDGIDVIISANDLIDRTIFFQMTRLTSETIKTERELQEEFERDKPIILGMIFFILQMALQDDTPIDRSEMTRMADFYEYAIKIGRVLGIEDAYTSQLINQNRKSINAHSLEENVLAQSLLVYMEYHEVKTHTMSELYDILQKVASDLHYDRKKMPGGSQALSRKLKEIKTELEEVGISFDIQKKWNAKVITIKNSKPRKVPLEL